MKNLLLLLLVIPLLPFLLVGIVVGGVVGAFIAGLRSGASFVRWTPAPPPKVLPLLLLLLIPTCLLGCPGESSESWRASTPAVVHESNGFRFGFYGPRSTGFAPDVAPALDVLTVEEIGLALEARAVELSARAPVAAADAVAALRGCSIWVVDDYAFEVGSIWAAGLREGSTVYVALWARAEVPAESDVPFDAPPWTVNPPAGGYGWRYGSGARLVPAADHELGHVLFGPYFEH